VASAVAAQAEGAYVAQIALSSPCDDRKDVVGIPQMAAPAPVLFEPSPGGPIEFAFIPAQLLGIQATQSADAMIANEDLLA
jgi:hypothetical protein